MMGTLMRNTDPHQKRSRSAPPRIGPSETPSAPTPLAIPTAVVRSLASVKTLRVIERVDGMIVAPAIPSRARAAMSIAELVAYAVSAEVAANAAVPMRSSFLRPIRSPMPPIVTSSPASAKPYTSAIHRICVPEGLRSAIRLGMARCRAVRSMDRTRTARQQIASVVHLRAVPMGVEEFMPRGSRRALTVRAPSTHRPPSGGRCAGRAVRRSGGQGEEGVRGQPVVAGEAVPGDVREARGQVTLGGLAQGPGARVACRQGSGQQAELPRA